MIRPREPLFRSGRATCRRYIAYRDGTDPRVSETRAEIEKTWARVEPFLDDELPAGAMDDFPARYWEMELAETFLECRFRLAPKGNSKGPDLRLLSPGCWVEAMVPGPGSGADAVPPLDGPGWVDHEKVILRLRAALKEKYEKYGDWISKRTIAPDEPFVVAVNGCAVGMASLEPARVPYVVSAVAPFGELGISFDPHDPQSPVTESHAFRPEVRNAKGSPIATTIFTDASHAGISGVLYSWSNEANRPRWPGGGYVFVHNLYAANPLPPGTFPFGREYFIVETNGGYSLRWCDHAP